MEKFQLAKVAYEDGCCSGMVAILNEEEKNYEDFTFFYDIEIDSLQLQKRTFTEGKSFSANKRLPQYLIANYWEITDEIKLALQMAIKKR